MWYNNIVTLSAPAYLATCSDAGYCKLETLEIVRKNGESMLGINSRKVNRGSDDLHPIIRRHTMNILNSVVTNRTQ